MQNPDPTSPTLPTPVEQAPMPDLAKVPDATPVQEELGKGAVDQTVEISDAAEASRNIVEGE